MAVGKGTCGCVLAVLLQAGCLGARSDLWEPPDVPVRETHARDDARADDGAREADAEAEADADVPEVIPCTTPCNDGFACTQDRCDPVLGCIYTPVDSRCDDGIPCTTDRCVAAAGADCAHEPVDSACDDGNECTLDECNLSRGCVVRTDPAACNDGVDCTEDVCDPVLGLCGHRPSDAACNDYADCTTDRCDAAAGCVYVPDDSGCPEFEHCDGTCHGCALDPAPPGLFLAFTTRELLRIDPVAVTSQVLRDMGYDFLDLAVTPDDRLWGLTHNELASIEPCGLHGSILYRFAEPTAGVLGAGADGWLYLVTASGGVLRIQPDTFAIEGVASSPAFRDTVSDIAAGPGGILYTAARGGSDPFTLYVIDPAAGSVTAVGPIGPWNVEALAWTGGTLYGMSAEGDLVRIDPATGAGEALGIIPPAPFTTYVGAASPPP